MAEWAPDQIDLSDPKNAPPNSRWDGSKWVTTKPTEAGYDPTWGGYVKQDDLDWLKQHPGDFDRADQALGRPTNLGWLGSVYQHQGWGNGRTEPPNPTDTSPSTPTSPPPSWPSGTRPPSSPYQNINYGLSGAYQGVFSDPLTKQYEQLLQAQMALYQQQQQQMQEQARQAAERRAATAAAVERLTGYTNQRVAKLQAPAYTGAEQEVLRTQLLDPMERDRTAANKRALEQIGARGFDPTSGIAQQLLQDVNRAYDEQRTRAQGTIATRQIEEQRSRDQEAQQLLQYLAMLPDATARGDLDFVNYTQNLINQPGQQAMSVSQLLADLPTKRLNDALATLGVAPSMSGANTSAIQLLQQAQQQRYMQQQQAAQYWNSIGRSFQP